jgi:predicted RNase H-like HicB family nuclease
MLSYTACYTKTESGYTGQLLEWPEIITEGATIEDCREMLEDAAREMIEVYKEDKLDIPKGHVSDIG